MSPSPQHQHWRQSGRFAALAFSAAMVLVGLGVIVPPPWSAPTSQQAQLTMVCVSGFSWDRIIRLHRKGQLPVMARLFSRSCSYGDIVSPSFPSDTAILATLFTGRLPAVHTIVRHEDLARLRSEDGPRIAIWDELAAQGKRCVVVGFPGAASPSRSFRGNIFYHENQLRNTEMTPTDYERDILRGHSVPSDLKQFLSACINSDVERGRIVRHTANNSAAAHLFTYFEGLGRWQERLTGSIDELPEAVKAELIDRYYVFFDSLLSAFEERLGANDTFLLLSERGNRNGCPSSWRNVRVSGDCPAIGFFYATGRHIREAAEPLFIKPADVVPTLVYLAGNPVRHTMNGIVCFDMLEDEFYFQHKLVYQWSAWNGF